LLIGSGRDYTGSETLSILAAASVLSPVAGDAGQRSAPQASVLI